ncbi:MAG TPA: hypothetical protein VGY99_05430 [Candidatus Binataceae bacterium]|jgi:hypothetical protein|nr:hypothetical protein [Candidatus Binataceae bacterium]
MDIELSDDAMAPDLNRGRLNLWPGVRGRRVAKQAAIASLEKPNFQVGRVQKWAQSHPTEAIDINAIPEKALN